MPDSQAQVDRLYKAGRRLLTIAVTVLAAVLAGMAVWPTARKHYYSARIASDDPGVRAHALEVVLPYAATDESLRHRLLDVLTRLARSEDGVGPLQARAAAGWLFRNVPAFTRLAESRLSESEGNPFVRLARLMILGGRWDVPSRPVEQQVRWLTSRYRATRGDDRADVVNAMARLGRAAGPSLRAVLERALSDPAVQVRRAAIEATAIVLGPDGLDMLLGLVNDPEPAARRKAILMIAATGAAEEATVTIARLLRDADASVRQTAVWAVAARQRPERPALGDPKRWADMLEKDPSPQVRAMAALAVRDNRRLIRHVQRSGDVAVRARCLWSLRPPLDQAHRDALLDVLGSERKYWVAVAAVAAIGRCAPKPTPPRVREALLTRLQRALRHGDDDLAAACLDALGELADLTLTSLLQDIVTKLFDRPWVALAAARAAVKIDAALGATMLVRILESRHEAVHDLAAFELSCLPEPARPRSALRVALRSPDEHLRSGAALGLALMSRQANAPDNELLQYLRERTDPTGELFETRLPLRGYYLCAQLLMGDASVRERLRSLVAAGRVGTTAACLSMLVLRDPAGLDGPLLDNTLMPPGLDARTFLCDERFGEVVARYLPRAPRVDWRTDPDMQAWQIDRLREWWRIHRAGLR